MTRFTEADVVVVGLIGERGREVGDFVKNVFERDQRANCCCGRAGRQITLVADTCGEPGWPPLRNIRDMGKNAADYGSLTRVAHARREIASSLRA